MFRDTQEDYLRYLLFDEQEDDFDFFNSNNNASQMNSNMDGNLLFNQNDQVLETDNNPFSTNSVFNNNKVNEFDKQQEEINQHLTEMTLNNNQTINEAGYNNHNLPMPNNYRNNFTNNIDPRVPFVGNTSSKFNGLSYEIRDGNENSRFDEYANQPNTEGYYPKSLDNGINEDNNRGLNQSAFMQPNHVNNTQYNNYGNSNRNNKESVDYDPRMSSPVNQNGNGYYQTPQQTQQQQNQSFDMMSSPNQQPAIPYNDEFQNINGNYYGDQQVTQPQQRDNRGGYFNIDQPRQQENNRGYYQQNQQQSHPQTAVGAQNQYDQGYMKNVYNNQNNVYQQQDGYANNTNSEQNNNNSLPGMQQTQEYYNDQSRQYPQNLQQQQQSQQQQPFYNTPQNQNSEYRNTYQPLNSNNTQNVYTNPQQPYYQNYDIQQIPQAQQPQVRPIGEVPILAEMRVSKRKSNAKLSNGMQLSKKSSSIKEQQQQKYEKKYLKAQQSQKVQNQIVSQLSANSQLSSSATTLQYHQQGGNGESVNASQYSSTDNNLPADALNSNGTTAYTAIPFNQNNSTQQNNKLSTQNSYQSTFYNGYQSHSHHHCCDGDDDEEEESHQQDEIENEDMDQPIQSNLLHSGHHHSSQLNDSNSHESNKDKSDLSCDQEGDSEKNSKADEIAILAESIKHCNKKNVVKNIMSAFLTFMNDRKNKIYTKQEQECIPTLYYSISKEGSVEDEDQTEEIRKKFKRYISQKSLNHYTVRLLILHPNYGPIFKHYLTNPIKKWINNSKVADLGAHIKMIGFFLACFQDNRVLEELKRHEKKRAHFS